MRIFSFVLDEKTTDGQLSRILQLIEPLLTGEYTGNPFDSRKSER